MSREEEDDSYVEDKKPTLDAKKMARVDREKKELLSALAGGNFSTQRTKVAYILNLFPDSRNSDITLALKYWETFQSDIYNSDGIKPRDLFKLERIHYIVRARAKIQNEYGLFQADEKIKKHRKQQEEIMHDAVLEDVKPKRVVKVFSDEAGKTQRFVIVASVWVLSGRSVFTISEAIGKWKEKSAWVNREVHFSKLGKKDFEPLKNYIGVILRNREFLSFKVIAVEKSNTKRTIEDVIAKLHEHMLIRGAQHEIQQGRMAYPREVGVTLDEEQSLDPFTLAEMKLRVSEYFEKNHNSALIIDTIQTVSSRSSALIQLADLVAGAVNRRLNSTGEKNHKDEMADWVIHTLDLSLSEEGIPGLDASALFRV